MICSPISTSRKNVICLIGTVHRQMSNHVYEVISLSPSNSCCLYNSTKPLKSGFTTLSGSQPGCCSSLITFRGFPKSSFRSSVSMNKASLHALTFRGGGCCRKTRINFSTGLSTANLSLLATKQAKQAKPQRFRFNIGPVSWQQNWASAGLLIGLLVCFSSSDVANAEANEKDKGDSDGSSGQYSHGKKVFTDYSVIGIPGDGRCLFRSVAHGACIRAGKPAPNERVQRELADELRAQVADELVKRREETEWFIEGDFDAYVSLIRKPHVWGGEPELLMASHVLRMPITVYMYDNDSEGLISIAEYGQEYGKDNPIKVLYHGFGHYDALHIPGRGGGRSRL